MTEYATVRLLRTLAELEEAILLLESRDHARLEGSVDRLTGLRDDILAALPGGEVMLVPATGHALFLETPKPSTERILRFLAKHPLS